MWGKPHTPLTAHLAVGNLLVRTDIKVIPLSASPVGESTKAKTFNPSEIIFFIVLIVGRIHNYYKISFYLHDIFKLLSHFYKEYII